MINDKPCYEYYTSKTTSSDRVHPSEAFERLKNAINQYRSRIRYLYIGRTNNPERRWREHQNTMAKNQEKPWHVMVVAYESWSYGATVQLESQLIEYVKQQRREVFEEVLWNLQGGARYYGKQDYYVYLLVDSGTGIGVTH